MAALLVGCVREGATERIEWPSMSTIAAVQSRGKSDAARVVRETFEQVERRLNRFDLESELVQLAKFPDAEILRRCDPAMRPCYEAAFRLRTETDGVFNPRWKGEGTMDLGAIAKGYAVDLAAERIVSELTNAPSVLLDLGGNLKAVGGSWKVGILEGETFELQEGEACATSAKYFRGEHIRNGLNGEKITNEVYSVTVIHPSSAMLADGLSTALFLMGRERGERFLKEHYPEARACWIFKE